MNILLTSVGRRTYLIEYFKEAMKCVGKVFASNSEYTYTLSHADEYVITPSAVFVNGLIKLSSP